LPSKRISDVMYCLKVQFARRGLPLEVVSDNNPFNAVEFRKFAQKYDSKHTTSSPRYSQSNGQAEAADKVIKNLYENAIEDREDPHLALLAWRNIPAWIISGSDYVRPADPNNHANRLCNER